MPDGILCRVPIPCLILLFALEDRALKGKKTELPKTFHVYKPERIAAFRQCLLNTLRRMWDEKKDGDFFVSSYHKLNSMRLFTHPIEPEMEVSRKLLVEEMERVSQKN